MDIPHVDLPLHEVLSPAGGGDIVDTGRGGKKFEATFIKALDLLGLQYEESVGFSAAGWDVRPVGDGWHQLIKDRNTNVKVHSTRWLFSDKTIFMAATAAAAGVKQGALTPAQANQRVEKAVRAALNSKGLPAISFFKPKDAQVQQGIGAAVRAKDVEALRKLMVGDNFATKRLGRNYSVTVKIDWTAPSCGVLCTSKAKREGTWEQGAVVHIDGGVGGHSFGMGGRVEFPKGDPTFFFRDRSGVPAKPFHQARERGSIKKAMAESLAKKSSDYKTRSVRSAVSDAVGSMSGEIARYTPDPKLPAKLKKLVVDCNHHLDELDALGAEVASTLEAAERDDDDHTIDDLAQWSNDFKALKRAALKTVDAIKKYHDSLPTWWTNWRTSPSPLVPPQTQIQALWVNVMDMVGSAKNDSYKTTSRLFDASNKLIMLRHQEELRGTYDDTKIHTQFLKSLSEMDSWLGSLYNLPYVLAYSAELVPKISHIIRDATPRAGARMVADIKARVPGHERIKAAPKKAMSGRYYTEGWQALYWAKKNLTKPVASTLPPEVKAFVNNTAKEVLKRLNDANEAVLAVWRLKPVQAATSPYNNRHDEAHYKSIDEVIRVVRKMVQVVRGLHPYIHNAIWNSVGRMSSPVPLTGPDVQRESALVLLYSATKRVALLASDNGGGFGASLRWKTTVDNIDPDASTGFGGTDPREADDEFLASWLGDVYMAVDALLRGGPHTQVYDAHFPRFIEATELAREALPYLWTSATLAAASSEPLIQEVGTMGPWRVLLDVPGELRNMVQAALGTKDSPIDPRRVATFKRMAEMAYKLYRKAGVSDRVLAGDLHLKVRRSGEKSGAGGYYTYAGADSNKLLVYADMVGMSVGGDVGVEDGTWILIHELAHRVYYRGLTANGRNFWNALLWQLGKPLSDPIKFEVLKQFRESKGDRSELLGVVGWKWSKTTLTKEDESIASTLAWWFIDQYPRQDRNYLIKWLDAKKYSDHLPTHYSNTTPREAWPESVSSMLLRRPRSSEGRMVSNQIKQVVNNLLKQTNENLDEARQEEIGRVGPIKVTIINAPDREVTIDPGMSHRKWNAARKKIKAAGAELAIPTEAVKGLVLKVREAHSALRRVGVPDSALKGARVVFDVQWGVNDEEANYNTANDVVMSRFGATVDTLIHELAHRIYFKTIGSRGRETWEGFIDGTGKPLTDAVQLRTFALVMDYHRQQMWADREDADEFDYTWGDVMRRFEIVSSLAGVRWHLSTDIEEWKPQDELRRHVPAVEMKAAPLASRWLSAEDKDNIEGQMLPFLKWLKTKTWNDGLPSTYANVHPEEAWAEAVADIAFNRLKPQTKSYIQREVMKALGTVRESLEESSMLITESERNDVRTLLEAHGFSEQSVAIMFAVPPSMAKQFPSKGEHDPTAPHISILIVGEVGDDEWRTVQRVAREVASEERPFSVKFGKYGEFKTTAKGPATIGWVGIEGAKLWDLHSTLWKRLADAGVKPAHRYGDHGNPDKPVKRLYHAHATLAYMQPGETFTGLIPQGGWSVSAFEVWRGSRTKVPVKLGAPAPAMMTESFARKGDKLIGYKVMRYDPVSKRVVSGANSRINLALNRGAVHRMPHPGIFMAADRRYVIDHYMIHDVNALITYEFSERDVQSGSLEDREPEIAVSTAKVLDVQIYDDEGDPLTEAHPQLPRNADVAAKMIRDALLARDQKRANRVFELYVHGGDPRHDDGAWGYDSHKATRRQSLLFDRGIVWMGANVGQLEEAKSLPGTPPGMTIIRAADFRDTGTYDVTWKHPSGRTLRTKMYRDTGTTWWNWDGPMVLRIHYGQDMLGFNRAEAIDKLASLPPSHPAWKNSMTEAATNYYHGTNVAPFTQFDSSKIGSATDAGLLGRGFYFSTDINIGRNKRTLLRSDLRFRNPLKVAATSWQPNKLQLVNTALGVEGMRGSALTRVLVLQGYDAVVLDYSSLGYKHQEVMIPKEGQITNTELVEAEWGTGAHAITTDDAGEGFWGNAGAGVLPIAKSTGRILIGKRSRSVNEPGEWGGFGGAMDKGENAEKAARREMIEELGCCTGLKLLKAFEFTSPSGAFRFSNFIGVVDDEFKPRLSWETETTEWVTFEELKRHPKLHFGMKALLKNSGSLIKRLAVGINEDAATFGGKHGKWIELSANDLRRNTALTKELFDLVSTAYAPIGGHSNIKTPSDVINHATFWAAADIDADPEADVVTLAKKKPAGLKSVGMGHDGTKKAKDFVINKKGLSLREPGHYAEMSGAMAHIMLKYHNAKSVNMQADVERVLGKQVEWVGAHPEGKYPKHPGWYRRKIGGQSHLKILLGSPFGVKSESCAPLGELVEDGDVRYKLHTTRDVIDAKAYVGTRLVGRVAAYEKLRFWAVAKAAVEPDFRRQGIATKLYKMVSDEACRRGKSLESEGYQRSPLATKVWQQIGKPIGGGDYEIPCESLIERSFTEKDIPESFYVATKLAPMAVDELIRHTLNGVTGIAADGRVLGSIGSAGKTLLIEMPGRETVNLNKLTRVMYENPEYWIQDDFAAAKRVLQSNTSGSAADKLLSNAREFAAHHGLFPALVGSSPRSSEIPDWGRVNFYGVKVPMPRIKNLAAFARYMERQTQAIYDKVGPDDREYGYGKVRQAAAEVTWQEWAKFIALGTRSIANRFRVEGEWVVKNKKLSVPRNTTLHVVDTGQAGSARRGEHINVLRAAGYNVVIVPQAEWKSRIDTLQNQEMDRWSKERWESLEERSFSPSDVPDEFRIVFYLGSDPEHGNAQAWKSLATGKLTGVTGISASGAIEAQFLDVARDAVLVMPGRAVVAQNKLTRMLYANIHYLLSNDMAAIKRIVQGSTYNPDRARAHATRVLMEYLYKALKQSGDSRYKNMLYQWEYAGVGSTLADDFMHAGKVNNVREFMNAMLKVGGKRAADKGRDSVSDRSFYFRAVYEEMATWSYAHWLKLLSKVAEIVASIYADEAEWISKSDALLIPDGSKLRLITKKIPDDIWKKYSALFPEGGEIDFFDFREEVSPLRPFAHALQHRGYVLERMKALGILKRYTVEWIYSAEFEKERAKYWDARTYTPPKGVPVRESVTMTAYHASDKRLPEGHSLDVGHEKPNEDYGIFVTPNNRKVRMWGRHVHTVHVEMRNPLVVAWKGDIPEKIGVDISMPGGLITKKLAEAIQRAGYDSVVWTDDGRSINKANEFILFNKQQARVVGVTESIAPEHSARNLPTRRNSLVKLQQVEVSLDEISDLSEGIPAMIQRTLRKREERLRDLPKLMKEIGNAKAVHLKSERWPWEFMIFKSSRPDCQPLQLAYLKREGGETTPTGHDCVKDMGKTIEKLWKEYGRLTLTAMSEHHEMQATLERLEEETRDYKQEYRDFHGKPEQKKNRAMRNRARRKIGLKKGDPREADHKTPLSKGGGNGKGNVRAVSFDTNRKKANKREAYSNEPRLPGPSVKKEPAKRAKAITDRERKLLNDARPKGELIVVEVAPRKLPDPAKRAKKLAKIQMRAKDSENAARIKHAEKLRDIKQKAAQQATAAMTESNIKKDPVNEGKDYSPESDYYHRQPGDTLEDVLQRWQSPPSGKYPMRNSKGEVYHHRNYPNQKMYDSSMPMMVPVKDLWEHREYTWKRGDARRSVPEWDALKAALKASGWSKDDPLIFFIGSQGGQKVGEGNHRLAISRELGVREVPVRFIFWNNKVTKNPQPSRAAAALSIEPEQLLKKVKRLPPTPENDALVDDILRLLESRDMVNKRERATQESAGTCATVDVGLETLVQHKQRT